MIYKRCNICRTRYEYGKKCSCVNKHNKKMNVIRGKEDNFYTSPAWRKLRLRILKRDQGVCIRCLIKHTFLNLKDLEGHHIKPRSKYPELELEPNNIITLCKTCNLELGTRETLDFEYEIPQDEGYSL